MFYKLLGVKGLNQTISQYYSKEIKRDNNNAIPKYLFPNYAIMTNWTFNHLTKFKFLSNFILLHFHQNLLKSLSLSILFNFHLYVH